MLVKRRSPRPAKDMHPTKRALIDTVVAMLDQMPVEQVTCDAVLDASEISRGSLYYHFVDFGDLVEHALALRFSRSVDELIAQFQGSLASAHSADEFRQSWLALAVALHDPSGTRQRFDRTVPYAAAASSERFRTMLGVEQQRLTDAHAEVLRSAQDRGWISKEFDAESLSVLMQAFALGSVIDDVTPRRTSTRGWDTAVTALLNRLLVTQ